MTHQTQPMGWGGGGWQGVGVKIGLGLTKFWGLTFKVQGLVQGLVVGFRVALRSLPLLRLSPSTKPLKTAPLGNLSGGSLSPTLDPEA